MRLLATCLGVVTTLLLASNVYADVDDSQPAICASTDIIECDRCIPGGPAPKTANEDKAMAPMLQRTSAA